jgi:hypothetical protein
MATEQDEFEALLAQAQKKLAEAEKAWHAAFAAAPVGQQRVMAAEIYERVRTATRGPF